MKQKEFQQRVSHQYDLEAGRRPIHPTHSDVSFSQQPLERRGHDRMSNEIHLDTARCPLSPPHTTTFSQRMINTRHTDDRIPGGEIQMGTARRPSSSQNVSYSQQSLENQRHDRMANEYPSMIQVKDEMISDYDYETVRENPCHESSIYTDDMTMIQDGKLDDENYPAPNRRQRQRPSWQRKESLQYETEREKRNGYLRRRGRGLVDSASILSAKTHEEIVVIVGGQGYYFDNLGFRIQIDSEAGLSKMKATAREIAQHARKKSSCREHPKLPSFSLSTRKRGIAKQREEEVDKLPSFPPTKHCEAPEGLHRRPKRMMDRIGHAKETMDDQRSGSTMQPSLVHQRDSTYDSECASSFLIQHLTDSLHMDYGDVNGSIPNHQSNMGLSRYCGNQSRTVMNYDPDDDPGHWRGSLC